jgi:hypothetical protein
MRFKYFFPHKKFHDDINKNNFFGDFGFEAWLLTRSLLPSIRMTSPLFPSLMLRKKPALPPPPFMCAVDDKSKKERQKIVKKKIKKLYGTHRMWKGGCLHCDVRLEKDTRPQGRLDRSRLLLLLTAALVIGARGAAAVAVVAAAAVRVRLLGNGAQREVRVVMAAAAGKFAGG